MQKQRKKLMSEMIDLHIAHAIVHNGRGHLKHTQKKSKLLVLVL